MRRFTVLASLAAVSLTLSIATAANAQNDDITVEGTRHLKRAPGTGAPIETVTHTMHVSTKGLDLRTDSGMREAEARVRRAAVEACRWLDDNKVLSADPTDCVDEATKSAMARTRSALAQN